ncbi:hypothetical protein ACHWGW_18970, partial [Klebsiella pneumoniae]
MTERVYYTSDATDGRAQIIACTAEADGRYAIELDRTLFHPQGGGQPADRGWIAGQVAGRMQTSMQLSRGGINFHLHFTEGKGLR